jgi:hypothetical protein
MNKRLLALVAFGLAIPSVALAAEVATSGCGGLCSLLGFLGCP